MTTADFEAVSDFVADDDEPSDRTSLELLDEEPEHEDANPTVVEFDGDTGTLHADARAALVALLSNRFIAASTHKKEWKGLLAHLYDIRSRLNDMYLDLEYDARYEVAFKVQVRNTDSTRTFPYLLRSMTWTREQTVVLVHLCRVHRNQTMAGVSRVVVAAADIQAFAASVRPKTATDHHMDAGRVERAITTIATAGLLEPTKEEGVFIISPIIERLMPVTKLRELLSFLTSEDSTDD